MRDFCGWVLSWVAEGLYAIGDFIFGFDPGERF